MDSFRDHAVGCEGNGDRIMLHDSIRDALFFSSTSAALAPGRKFHSLIPGSSSCPAGLYLPLKCGHPAAYLSFLHFKN